MTLDYRPLCECENVGCRAELPISYEDYGKLRGTSPQRRYVVLTGHQSPTDEIVGPGDGYLVVRGTE